MNTSHPPPAGALDFSGNGRTNWFALHVRSNFERTTCTILRNKGYQEFLPTYRRKRRWSDRVKDEDVPLFPGYLFCRLDQDDRLPVLSSSGVVGIVGIGKTPMPVEAPELEAIWRVTHSDLAINPIPHLSVGETVVLDSGPLSGLKGILLECKKQRRLVVSVTLLQRSVAVEIDGEHVRPLGGIQQLIGRNLVSFNDEVVLRKGPAQIMPAAKRIASGGSL